MRKKTERKSFYPEIREHCFQLRAMAYLIGNQRLDAAPPLEAEDISYGMGRILEGLVDNVQELTNAMEDQELEPSKTEKEK